MRTSPLDLTTDLRELLALAAEEDAADRLLRRGLDMLARIAPYDLATVFFLEEGRLNARVVRGALVNPDVRRHSLNLSDFPSIQEALDSRRARALTEEDHAHGEGDPFDGVLDLPAGHSCMVAPLCAGQRCFGILTLDRARCEPYAPEAVNLVEVYAQLLAVALQATRDTLSLKRLHQQDHEHAKALEEEIGGEAIPLLEAETSEAMRTLVWQSRQVAQTDTPVLILGETGTGKERLARAIHQWSPRADQPFIALNCAAVPENLLESELFGHVKGAFTGASRDRAGRFQLANGGTLLLDEIGEMSIELQSKLLRVLQEGSFEPVGSDRTVKVDVRILAATNADLQKAMQERRFREDLFYRLNVFPLRLPPLRERLDALPYACAILLDEQARRTGRRGLKLNRAALEKLRRYRWPGNLRELANVLERAAILTRGKTIEPAHLLLDTHDTQPDGPDSTRLEDVERAHIIAILRRTGGRIYGDGGAADLLGLKPSTLQSRMKKLGVERTLIA